MAAEEWARGREGGGEGGVGEGQVVQGPLDLGRIWTFTSGRWEPPRAVGTCALWRPPGKQLGGWL